MYKTLKTLINIVQYFIFTNTFDKLWLMSLCVDILIIIINKKIVQIQFLIFETILLKHLSSWLCVCCAYHKQTTFTNQERQKTLKMFK